MRQSLTSDEGDVLGHCCEGELKCWYDSDCDLGSDASGCVGTLPAWPHSRSWGYGPSGGLGLIVVVLLVLLLMGRL